MQLAPYNTLPFIFISAACAFKLKWLKIALNVLQLAKYLTGAGQCPFQMFGLCNVLLSHRLLNYCFSIKISFDAHGLPRFAPTVSSTEVICCIQVYFTSFIPLFKHELWFIIYNFAQYLTKVPTAQTAQANLVKTPDQLIVRMFQFQ